MKGIVAIVITGLLVPVAARAQGMEVLQLSGSRVSRSSFRSSPPLKRALSRLQLGSLPITRYTVRQEHIIYTASVWTTAYERRRADHDRGGRKGTWRIRQGDRRHRRARQSLLRTRLEHRRDRRQPLGLALFFVDKHLYTVVGKALPAQCHRTIRRCDPLRGIAAVHRH